MTILASLPTSQSGLRSSINRNLTDIVELHEEILGELHQVVPGSEYNHVEVAASPTTSRSPHHRRWRSLNAVPENKDGMSWLRQGTGLASDPQTAADVAQVFAKRVFTTVSHSQVASQRYLPETKQGIGEPVVRVRGIRCQIRVNDQGHRHDPPLHAGMGQISERPRGSRGFNRLHQLLRGPFKEGAHRWRLAGQGMLSAL